MQVFFKLFRQGRLLDTLTIRDTEVRVGPAYDSAEIAEIDMNGSFGPWGSIPVPAVY